MCGILKFVLKSFSEYLRDYAVMCAFPALLPVGSLLVIRNPNRPTEKATRLSWVFLKIRVLCGESRVCPLVLWKC